MPCAFMRSAASWAHRKVPRTWTRSTSSKSSSVILRNERSRTLPALFTRAWMPPNSSAQRRDERARALARGDVVVARDGLAAGRGDLGDDLLGLAAVDVVHRRPRRRSPRGGGSGRGRCRARRPSRPRRARPGSPSPRSSRTLPAWAGNYETDRIVMARGAPVKAGPGVEAPARLSCPRSPPVRARPRSSCSSAVPKTFASTQVRFR